jgi:outer membrane receptor protein involved in Fe transport
MRRHLLLSGISLSTAICAAAPAYAQDAAAAQASATPARAAASDPLGSADIVVTARKRGNEKLQDIPASISAISGDALQKAGETRFVDFAYHVPGLTFTDQGPGLKRYTLRGVQSAGQEQVAVYYDEVPVPGIQSSTGDSGSQIGDLQLYDLERVEVLKGPQSTTFGANAQTGAVRFILKKPQLTDFGGSVQLDGNSVAHGGLGGSVYGMTNVPLIKDTLGLRFVGYYDHTAGYIDNVRLNDKNINSDDTAGIRAMLRWKPAPNITIDAMAWYQKRDTHGASDYFPFDSFHTKGDPSDQGYKDNVPDFAYVDTGEYKAGWYVKTPRPDRQQIYSLTGTAELGFATLTLTGSIYDRNYQFYRDNTYSIISIGGGPAGATNINGKPTIRPDVFLELTDQTQSLNQKTVEARLNSTGSGPFQWLAGVFYRNRGSGFRSYSPIVDANGEIIHADHPPTGYSPTEIGAGIDGCNPCGFARVNTRTIDEKAVFGEATYDITHWLEIMGGLRWFDADQHDFGATLFQSPLLGNTLPAPYDRKKDEHRLIKKAEISIKPNKDLTFYALASQGFRLGGTNQSATVLVPDGYDSDSLWNYEIGMKSAWMNRKLIANVALYRIDWSNIQVAGRDPTGTFGFVGNAGSARFQGMEFELTARPLHGLDVSGGFNWLPEHELTEDQVSTTFAAPGKKGDKIPRVPTWTGTFSVQYTTPLPALEGWSGYVRGDYSYKGPSGTELRPTTSTYRLQHGYSIVNLRIGTDSDNGFGAAVYVNNLFDKAGDVFLSAAGGQPTAKITNQPRTVGITLSKQF